METPFTSRIYRSATFEGMADSSGFPTDDYFQLYQELAKNGVKNIITGCTFISQDGKMVQPGQAGIDSDEMICHYQRVTAEVHHYGSKIYMQISHAGRQTSSIVTKRPVVGASSGKSAYFLSKPKPLSSEEISEVIESYANSALRAQKSGFDGVQIHAAHGYLVHQFLHPCLNRRKDEFGINRNSGIGYLFLQKIITAVKNKCGEDYPVLVKISGSDDLNQPFSENAFLSLIRMLDLDKVSGIEISYGTMEDALNIFRGQSIPIDVILKHNFRYKIASPFFRSLWKKMVLPLMNNKFIKFSENYNLQYSELAKKNTDIPIICVGGFRCGQEILRVLAEKKTDFVSLCRPLICEPDFILKLIADNRYISKCKNCNICAIMCDSGYKTRCYSR